MDSIKLPVREVEVNGEKFHVAYPIPSLFALQDQGVDLLADDVKEQFEKKDLRRRLEDTVKIFWAGLLFEKPEIKLEDVSRMVYLGNLDAIAKVCLEAFTASLPSKKEEAADPLDSAGPVSVN